MGFVFGFIFLEIMVSFKLKKLIEKLLELIDLKIKFYKQDLSNPKTKFGTLWEFDLNEEIEDWMVKTRFIEECKLLDAYIYQKYNARLISKLRYMNKAAFREEDIYEVFELNEKTKSGLYKNR